MSGRVADEKTKTGVKALIMVTDTGRTLQLGGIVPGSATVAAGQRVTAGQPIATIGRYPGVKGKPGPAMLHFQLYGRPLTEGEVNKPKKWDINAAPPADLIDGESYLKGPPPTLVTRPSGCSARVRRAGRGPRGRPAGREGPGRQAQPAVASALIVGGLAAAGLIAGLIIVTLPTRPARASRRAA